MGLFGLVRIHFELIFKFVVPVAVPLMVEYTSGIGTELCLFMVTVTTAFPTFSWKE